MARKPRKPQSYKPVYRRCGECGAVRPGPEFKRATSRVRLGAQFEGVSARRRCPSCKHEAPGFLFIKVEPLAES